MSYIETARLLLRTWLPADIAPLAAIYGDTEEATRAAVERMSRDYERDGMSLWPVVLKTSGTLIGACGLIGVRDGEQAELGLTLARAYWGEGYAYEAGAATLAFGFATLRARSIVALVGFENARCIRLVNRLGMRFDRVVRERRRELLRYRAERPVS